MFEILSLYGIPEEMISAIKVLYTDTSSSIFSSDGETESFRIKAVILQGYTLAFFLFIIIYLSFFILLSFCFTLIKKSGK